MNTLPPTSVFCTSTSAVIQIQPGIPRGQTEINGREAQTIRADVILPKSNATTIACPLNYFQENASLRDKWIRDDSGHQHTLDHIDGLSSISITVLENDLESPCCLPNGYNARLLEYFRLDVCLNKFQYNNFDCLAFVSFLANAEFCCVSPPFEYELGDPGVGDIVAISDGTKLPNSIQHFALSLGDDKYISKFGRTEKGTQSLVEIMNLDGMKSLFDCSHVFVATLKTKTNPWSEKSWRKSGVPNAQNST